MRVKTQKSDPLNFLLVPDRAQLVTLLCSKHLIVAQTIAEQHVRTLTIFAKMPNCASFGCTNRSTKDKSINFNRIPSAKRNKTLRQEWIKNIRRDEENVPKDSGFFICSHHFEPECFQRDLEVFSVVVYFFKLRNILRTNTYFSSLILLFTFNFSAKLLEFCTHIFVCSKCLERSIEKQIMINLHARWNFL